MTSSASVSTPEAAASLRAAIDRAAPRLRAMRDEDTTTRPAPGKWSPREIVGHLIDSASNNHQRFVRARWQDDLVFPGYAQDDWVAAQRYADAPWADLVDLFVALNRHLARVIESTPEHVRTQPRARHNLDERAFHPIPIEEPATLDYFMHDYVGHLRHHLIQILGADWDARELTPPAWQRLDPRTITVERIEGAIFVAIVSVVLLTAAIIFVLSTRLAFWLDVSLVTGSLLSTLLLGWHFYRWPRLAYARASYRLDDDGIEIRRGVVWRSIVDVPRSRVQHTDVSQGPLERRYGLGTVSIYTAGNAHADVHLSGIAHETAIAIRDQLLPHRRADVV